MAETKEKRYVSDNAQLMAEWNWEKNEIENLDPRHLTLGMAKNAWWKCSSCGHKWNAAVYTRTSGHGCPKCNKKKDVNTIDNY